MLKEIETFVSLGSVAISLLGISFFGLYFIIASYFSQSTKKIFLTIFFFICGLRISAIFILPNSIGNIIFFYNMRYNFRF